MHWSWVKTPQKLLAFLSTAPVHISHIVVFLFYPQRALLGELSLFYMWLCLSIFKVVVATSLLQQKWLVQWGRCLLLYTASSFGRHVSSGAAERAPSDSGRRLTVGLASQIVVQTLCPSWGPRLGGANFAPLVVWGDEIWLHVGGSNWRWGALITTPRCSVWRIYDVRTCSNKLGHRHWMVKSI